MDTIIWAVVSAVGAVAVYAAVTNMVARTSIRKRRETALREAEAEAEMIKKERILQAKEKFMQLKSEHDRQFNERNQKIVQTEQEIRRIEQSSFCRRRFIEQKREILKYSKKMRRNRLK